MNHLFHVDMEAGMEDRKEAGSLEGMMFEV
jgi:hypothetical protein